MADPSNPSLVDRAQLVCYHKQVLQLVPMQDEYLTRCVVNPINRSVNIYSSEGNHKTLNCENMDEFLNVLKVAEYLTTGDNAAELVFTD